MPVLQEQKTGHGRPAGCRRALLYRIGLLAFGALTQPARRDRPAPGAVGRKHPVVAGQIHPRPRHQRRQPRHEIQRLEDDVRGAVPVRRLELVANIPRRRQ